MITGSIMHQHMIAMGHDTWWLNRDNYIVAQVVFSVTAIHLVIAYRWSYVLVPDLEITWRRPVMETLSASLALFEGNSLAPAEMQNFIMCLYEISHTRIHTAHPIRCTHGDLCNLFSQIIQGCFTGIGEFVRQPQCQRSNLARYKE